MKNNEMKAFVELLTGALEVYSQRTSKLVVNVWWNALEKYDFNVVQQAFSAHIVDPDVGQFAPKPANIIRNIDGSRETRAMLAWAKVQKAIGSVGGGSTVCFDDRFIHATIADMGGWSKLCAVDEDEMPFKAKEFEKRYNSHSKHGVKEFPRKLIGHYEASNLAQGFMHFVTAPVTVGDLLECRKVYKFGSDNISLINKEPIALAHHVPATSIENKESA
ncbi:MAG: DUF6475 domain-containing protein [Parashewanella sp.]